MLKPYLFVNPQFAGKVVDGKSQYAMIERFEYDKSKLDINFFSPPKAARIESSTHNTGVSLPLKTK